MKTKDHLKLKIESVAFGGDGIGRHEGFVVFVPFTAEGDEVTVEIIQRKKSFARGRLLDILTPSPFRTDPLCPYFGRCGGCAYQHIDYAHQLTMKRRQVEDAFVKIAKIAAPKVEAVIGSPRIYGYRGKATLHALNAADGFRMGFMDTSGGLLTDIDRCAIMHETINDQIRRLKAGGLISSPEEDIIMWSEDRVDNNGDVVRKVKGKTFTVPHDGFFQANLYLTDRMVDEVCRLLETRKVETLVDACCGCGLFSIFASSYASRILGVEIYEKSVHHAKLNAANLGIKNAEFICGDVSAVLKDMAKKKETVDAVILDPPRTGMEMEALTAISEIKPDDIIYISCNPATQARDVKMLYESGYELLYLQPIDMFPQTQHIETVGLLGRK